MRFGRLSHFIFGNTSQSQMPSVAISPQQPNTQQVSPGLGQQHSTPDTTQQSAPETNLSTNAPKKKDLFKGLHEKHRDTIVFSQLQDRFALRRIKNVEWREEYTSTSSAKPNFYRFVGYNKETNQPEYFLLIRGDKPSLEGRYRVVIDKIGHKGTARAKYYDNADAMLEFVSKTYGIDVSKLEITLPDPKMYVDNLVKRLKEQGVSEVETIFNIELGGSEDENREAIALIIKTALSTMKPDEAIDIINKVEEVSKKYFPIDLTEEKKKYAKYGLSYKKNKDKYKEMFDEQVPFLTRDQKVIDCINRFYLASTTNNKFYIAMINDMKTDKVEITNDTKDEIIVDDLILPGDKPLVIPPNDFAIVPKPLADTSVNLKKLVNDEVLVRKDTSGVYMGDFARYLQQMNALNYSVMQIASEVAQAGVKVTLNLINNTKKKIKIDDITPEIVVNAGDTITVSSKMLRESEGMQEKLRSKELAIVGDSIKEKWVGYINQEKLKKTLDYLKASADSYEQHKGKPVKSFEYKLKMYDKPETGWRPNVTEGTFRAELDMGDMFVPAPKEYLNDTHINEHFSANECIAFAFVHEQMFEDKKIWILDEYQSDLVQQIGKLSDSPEDISWYNPEGKSKRERFRSTVYNYYKDWHRVFMNKLIKKAKKFDVDELWVIRGQDIFDYWHHRGDFGEIDEIERERKLRLFRRVYDNTAIEYSQHANDPEMQPLIKKYEDLVLQISNFYDALDKLDIFAILTKPEDQLTEKQQERKGEQFRDITEEQKKKKIEGLDVEKAKAESVADIVALKKELEDVMEKVSVMRKKTKDMPPEIYNGKYHVIDIQKVPDDKLAVVTRQLTKYATMPISLAKQPIDLDMWKQEAYNWITQTWMPSYIEKAKEYGEKIMSEEKQKQVALEWFWERQIPRELKTNSELLLAIRDYLRERFGMPNLDYSDNIKLYTEGINIGRRIFAWDNPDPSYEDSQTSPMETSMDNRLVNPDDILYKRKKGRGSPYGDPAEDGELKCNLPASVQIECRTANEIVEKYLIDREKELVDEPQIRQELLEQGITEEEINDTYRDRTKSLYKQTK